MNYQKYVQYYHLKEYQKVNNSHIIKFIILYNSEFENKKAIDFLVNQDQITFDILSGGIVLINKNEQSLSIITNINKLNQSDINILISLLNSKILLI